MTGTSLQKRTSSTEVAFPNEMPNKKTYATPPTQVRGLVFWLFVVGFLLFGGLGTWAALAPVNSAVVANGTFEVDGDLQVVQHLEGGIVDAIHVREGDHVEQGQIIAVLDDARARSRTKILHNQLISSLAREARLRSEYVESDTIILADSLVELMQDSPDFEAFVAGQQELLTTNLRTFRGRLGIFDDRIVQMNEQLAGIRERHTAQTRRLELVREEVADLKQLHAKGLAPKSRYTQRMQVEISLIGDIGETESDIQSVLQQIAEMKERILQVRRDRELALAENLETLKATIFEIEQRLESARDQEERLVVRAPVTGQVVGFELNTIGEVIEPRQTILQIVPDDSTFVIEARVNPGDIDEVATGMDVKVRLTAYSFRKTPPVNGQVSQVSADAFFDDTLDMPYYKVFVTVPEEEFTNLNGVRAVPSMPVQVMIATGEQTFATYLLDPVLGGLETAMTEGE